MFAPSLSSEWCESKEDKEDEEELYTSGLVSESVVGDFVVVEEKIRSYRGWGLLSRAGQVFLTSPSAASAKTSSRSLVCYRLFWYCIDSRVNAAKYQLVEVRKS